MNTYDAAPWSSSLSPDDIRYMRSEFIEWMFFCHSTVLLQLYFHNSLIERMQYISLSPPSLFENLSLKALYFILQNGFNYVNNQYVKQTPLFAHSPRSAIHTE